MTMTHASEPIVAMNGHDPDRKPTEDEVAISFAASHYGRWLYNASQRRWLQWTGSHWQTDHMGAATEAIRAHCRSAGGRSFRSANKVRAVRSLSETAPEIATHHALLDRDPWLLATPNGTVDLRTGNLRPADPTDRITRCTAVSPQPGQPERWLQFLSEATGGDAGMIRFLQQLAGYCLTGDTREQVLFFFYGEGGTGKSTYQSTILGVLNDYAKMSPMETFISSPSDRHPTELAMLDGARVVAANETKEGRRWESTRIKSLSGCDPVTARFMGKDFFTYVPGFKLLFFGNHAPSLEIVDDAMRRRFHIIPFDMRPKKADKRLGEKIAKEYPQILQWMVDGCLDWQRNGLIIPPKVVDATGSYFQAQDLFSDWLEDEVERDSKSCTSVADALASWNRFRVSAGERTETSRDLAQRLRRAKFESGRAPHGHSSRPRVWRYMRLKNAY